ncbi:hypothetical protein [Antarctobacter sp.]|uniref:hypothetical protein n=1 Tax=Antarctobacter sp. TaxID=1872577 RepID=UPI002B2747B2|nr:hypothetical protein [Antarctobacter sp.]
MSVLLVAVAGLELMARFTGIRSVQDAAWVAMLLAVLMSARRLSLREHYLVAASAAVTVLVIVLRPEPNPILIGALDQAVFLLSFILLLGLLQATAKSSPSVADLGAFLTRQPPGRRYAALSGGTALLAVLFNIGVVSFLVPLIQRGIHRAAPGDALNPIREQRQISALLRGFAWSVTWSPTAIAPLIVADLLPDVDRIVWMGYAFPLFIVLMVAGWIEDRVRFRAFKPKGLSPIMAWPRTAALRFAATTGWFLLLVLGFVWLFDESIVFGVLAACPLMVIGWLAAQQGRAGVPARLRQMVGTDLPGSINVAVTLAASGYIGRAAAGLTPAADVAKALGLAAMPDWLILAILPTFTALISLLALSPTMMAVFLGSFFAALPVLPADPTLIAFSISCGWALSMTFSPFATLVLIVSRASGIPISTLTWRWNILFTTFAAILLFPVFYLLTGGQ